jgi:sugar phosphate isomerase/epimerase
MIRALSTHLFVNHRLTTVWLDRIWEAGVPMVEIAETEKIKRRASVDEIKRALEGSETIPFRYLIQHIGVGGEEYDDRKVEAAFTALEELNVFAGQRGVEVLLEKIPNRLATAERLNLFLTQTHLENRYCFDVGHAHLDRGIKESFGLMKERIASTHIHDNDGVNDSHLFPAHGEGGTIDWKETMALLRSRADQYPLLLELREVPGMESTFGVLRQVFEALESL